nr:cupin domain-containing protein [Segatella hominis]
MVKTGVFFLLLQIKNKITSIYIIISEKMVIDFEKIAEAHLEGFKGGKGKLDTRNYVDDKVKIMYSTLRPGASTGLHTHEGNCEIIYVVSGTATFHYDDTVEEVRQGQVHYCPMNHAHYMENLTDHDLVYLAIVPEHH